MLPAVALFLAVALASPRVASAQAQAEVRVSFSSPLHSYSHGSLATPPSEQAPLVSSSRGRSLLVSQAPIRRGRLVQLLFPPETSESREEDAIEFQLSAFPPTPDEVDQELLPLPAPATLARILEGPLFFGAFPHATALLRYERAREAAGLGVDRLGSARPESPFYRWPLSGRVPAVTRGRRRSNGSSTRRRQWRTVY